MSLIHRLLRALPLALACAAARADAADAQLPALARFPVEARGGIVLPADDFRRAADGGVAGEVSVGWQALPLVGVYAAYEWAHFEWSDTGGTATDRGFAAGVRISLPVPLIPIDPWIRAGIVAHKLEAETLREEAKRGWEAGAGLSFPLARRITLTPGVVWTQYQHGSGNADGELLHVRHLRADVGLRLRL
jgi:opacity protein-like surface antigen